MSILLEKIQDELINIDVDVKNVELLCAKIYAPITQIPLDALDYLNFKLNDNLKFINQECSDGSKIIIEKNNIIIKEIDISDFLDETLKKYNKLSTWNLKNIIEAQRDIIKTERKLYHLKNYFYKESKDKIKKQNDKIKILKKELMSKIKEDVNENCNKVLTKDLGDVLLIYTFSKDKSEWTIELLHKDEECSFNLEFDNKSKLKICTSLNQ